jgi:Zn finger protein HypA/HybF involved in hydrogenase expression
MFKTIWDINNEDFIKYVNESKTYRDVLKKCGYTNLSNNKTIKKRITLLNLSVDHFVKYILPTQQKIALSEILIENSKYNCNTHIKKRLYEELNWEYKCLHCEINEWQGEKIPLELDHINGNNTDNRIENLRLLCPNCHSLTSTFRGKNKMPIEGVVRKCTDCNDKIHNSNVSGYCKKCVVKYRTQNLKIKDRPSLATLENDLKELKTFVAVGKKYNVSDNTIRKWIRKYNNEGIQDLNKLKNLNINELNL